MSETTIWVIAAIVAVVLIVVVRLAMNAQYKKMNFNPTALPKDEWDSFFAQNKKMNVEGAELFEIKGFVKEKTAKDKRLFELYPKGETFIFESRSYSVIGLRKIFATNFEISKTGTVITASNSSGLKGQNSNKIQAGDSLSCKYILVAKAV